MQAEQGYELIKQFMRTTELVPPFDVSKFLCLESLFTLYGGVRGTAIVINFNQLLCFELGWQNPDNFEGDWRHIRLESWGCVSFLVHLGSENLIFSSLFPEKRINALVIKPCFRSSITVIWQWPETRDASLPISTTACNVSRQSDGILAPWFPLVWKKICALPKSFGSTNTPSYFQTTWCLIVKRPRWTSPITQNHQNPYLSKWSVSLMKENLNWRTAKQYPCRKIQFIICHEHRRNLWSEKGSYNT